MKRQPVRALRCAIYTRVSTEHGLEQEFNSLDSHAKHPRPTLRARPMKAGAACRPAMTMAASRADGWNDRRCSGCSANPVPPHRRDRRLQGGSPHRSLTDFAKLVELFDAHGVSFVSVTQAFNTTTSMGRLTLNVLLSFAQFEREVTGERIRDKIAASKKKGIWMGGVVPLGYRVENRALHIVEAMRS